jgi:chaperone required for assembly of F1-ATPase
MSGVVGPKRFYKEASVAPHENGFAVTLDGRIPKTPAKNHLILPNAHAAQLVASEWAMQGDSIDPASMPVTRLINVALDHGATSRDAMVDQVVKHASTDLVCYRAPTPDSLIQAQAAAWDPLLDWAKQHLNIELVTTTGALAIPQSPVALERAARAAQALDDLRLTALAFANGLAGSAIVALALVHGQLSGEDAFKAIRVEEDWQAQRWGRDPDEEKVAGARRLDLIAVEALVQALAA